MYTSETEKNKKVIWNFIVIFHSVWLGHHKSGDAVIESKNTKQLHEFVEVLFKDGIYEQQNMDRELLEETFKEIFEIEEDEWTIMLAQVDGVAMNEAYEFAQYTMAQFFEKVTMDFLSRIIQSIVGFNVQTEMMGMYSSLTT